MKKRKEEDEGEGNLSRKKDREKRCEMERLSEEIIPFVDVCMCANKHDNISNNNEDINTIIGISHYANVCAHASADIEGGSQ